AGTAAEVYDPFARPDLDHVQQRPRAVVEPAIGEQTGPGQEFGVVADPDPCGEGHLVPAAFSVAVPGTPEHRPPAARLERDRAEDLLDGGRVKLVARYRREHGQPSSRPQ